jgi:hypothetical protein
MAKYLPNESSDLIDELLRRNAMLDRRINSLESILRIQGGGTPLHRLDILNYPQPFEGQRAIDVLDDQHAWYANGEWHKAGGGQAIYEILVFEDINTVVVGDAARIFKIPEDLDGAVLTKVEAWVSTVGTGVTTEIQIRNITAAVDMLSTKISIDVSEKNSEDAATQPVVNLANGDVSWGDHIAIDVDAAGTGAKGLGVILYFLPLATVTLALQGSQGPPGGVTSWEGEWEVGPTTYFTGQVVNNGGTSYVAIQNVPIDIEPGVTVGWEAYWMVLAGGQQISAIEVILNGNGYVFTTGVKAYLEVPFACTITSVVMLADVVGSVIVDIWKDTYANAPPTDADSITSATPPTMASALKSTDTTLTGWTTAIAAGDVLAFNIDSVSLISRLTISLKIART